jgi:hypothetical protein
MPSCWKVSVLQKLFDVLARSSLISCQREIDVLWHAGEPLSGTQMRVETRRFNFLGSGRRHRNFLHRVDGEAAEIVSKMAPSVQIPVAPVINQALGRNFTVGGIITGSVVIAQL